MDLSRLTEFENLFGHRYQALALLCLLEEGPMRWSDVGRAMHRRAEQRIEDKDVTRSLKALLEAGYIRAVAADDGAQMRVLTADGVSRAKRITGIFAILDNHRSPAESTPGERPAPR